MSRNSITFRLSLFFAITSTLVLLVVGTVIGHLVDEHFKKLDFNELASKLELTRHILSAVRDNAGLNELPRRLDDALIGHGELSVAVFASNGKSLFSTPGANFPPSLLDARGKVDPARPITPTDWTRGERHFRGISAQARAGLPDLPPFTVAVALGMERHTEFMSAFHKTLWTSVAIGALLTSLLGWFAARRGLAPVHAITSIAKAISAERLDERLPLDAVPVELADLANSFNDMLSRLDDSFRRLSDFSADLAHELRTPVSNLVTQTQVALSKARSADEYREILYSNLEEYDRITRMISDMLFIAKTDNGLIVPQCEPIDLAAEIDGLIEFYQALAEEKSVVLARAGDGQISGEKLMLRRAVSNLLSNAIRHTPKRGNIVVSVESANPRMVRIAVENTGDDIPSEHLPRLFDRFYRSDPSRQRNSDGAGLGLAIAKSIVDAHGGKLAVSSNNGLTRFTITLPVT